MKRSEMLNILGSAIVEHLNCYCCSSDEEMYDKILSTLENAGMKKDYESEYDLNKLTKGIL